MLKILVFYKKFCTFVLVMEQLSFFAEAGQTVGLPCDVLTYHSGFLGSVESDAILAQLIESTPWKQKVVRYYDKEVITPRLSAWYGSPDQLDYTAIGKSTPLPWTHELLQLKKLVEPVAGITFNSVLLNYYRDGQDSVTWHSDNETVMGSHPVIASLSFGQVRCFDIRLKANHAEKYSIKLEHGSLLLMKGDLQQKWDHRIPKSKQYMRPRINLTFRKIISPMNP
ncbi:alpha-ketoglutarate-dependent dioxygenase AlkB family protein [Pedobacter mucosus]|uniref:alpha-ketoglutarate-dependent dioxygenase AlkB family protein n=1 Tax=Pedobacter mucosus TaxID=2895286 RepID=UPI001EE3DB7B|nr:alpha-ketoglutarate-dependent dioxygenase AlkB [Pedobacter mucosus]UKT62296.1 alpha-ketoglutarate-dependent dioxygenase AlkB [Pedobacter mucosus]